MLTLASGSRANSPDRYLIPPARYDRFVWMIGYGEAAPREYDVVFNAVADADAAAALPSTLSAFCAGNDRALLNPPERIAATARDNAPILFQGVADLVVPRCAASRVAADLAGLDASRSGCCGPSGSHGGERLLRVTLAEAAARARRAAALPHRLSRLP